MSAHTLGPWYYCGSDPCPHTGRFNEIYASDRGSIFKHTKEELPGDIHDSDGLSIISAVWHNDSTAGLYCTPANARLIAASPTMREYIERKAADGDVEARKILEAIDAHS